jgi:apolipoprotein D and lipocalin family protein
MELRIDRWWLICTAVACMWMTSVGQAAADTAKPAPLEPVAQLDVDRYMGTWYEIAKYPNRFQRACASNTRAEYHKRPDGTIDVLNQCTNKDGGTDKAKGLARPDNEAPMLSSKLQVRFAPAWLSWIPLVWGRYWVVMLDPNYRYAVVSEPKRKYLWILSREPVMDEATYQLIVKRIIELGLDPARLVRTVQR